MFARGTVAVAMALVAVFAAGSADAVDQRVGVGVVTGGHYSPCLLPNQEFTGLGFDFAGRMPSGKGSFQVTGHATGAYYDCYQSPPQVYVELAGTNAQGRTFHWSCYLYISTLQPGAADPIVVPPTFLFEGNCDRGNPGQFRLRLILQPGGVSGSDATGYTFAPLVGAYVATGLA